MRKTSKPRTKARTEPQPNTQLKTKLDPKAVLSDADLDAASGGLNPHPSRCRRGGAEPFGPPARVRPGRGARRAPRSRPARSRR